MDLAPFRLKPWFSERVWGKRDLRPWYEDTGTTELVGEAWLTGPQCIVETGELAGQTFASAFTSQYPSLGEPGAVGLNAYDAVQIFVQAAKKADSTNPAKIVQELSSATFQDAMEASPVKFESTGFIQAQPEVVVDSASGTISKVG